MLFSCGERIGSVSVFVRMKLKHYIMKHDGTNYLYITPLQNQGLVLALLLRAQVCLYGFCDTSFPRAYHTQRVGFLALLACVARAGVSGGGGVGARGRIFFYIFGAGGFPTGGGIAWCVFCDGGASPPLTLIPFDSPSRTSLCGLSSRLDRLRLWPRAPLSLGSASAGRVWVMRVLF